MKRREDSEKKIRAVRERQFNDIEMLASDVNEKESMGMI